MDQIGDMKAYPRHSNHKATEGLCDFVEGVSDMNQSRQSHKVGTRRNRWKAQKRNDLENIKRSKDLNAALSYLLEK